MPLSRRGKYMRPQVDGHETCTLPFRACPGPHLNDVPNPRDRNVYSHIKTGTMPVPLPLEDAQGVRILRLPQPMVPNMSEWYKWLPTPVLHTNSELCCWHSCSEVQVQQTLGFLYELWLLLALQARGAHWYL